MNASKLGLIVCGVALVALGALWHTLPVTTPPLYDGACMSDPYRYLSPPAGTHEAAALPATKNLTVSTTSPATELTTNESPPQAQLLIEQGSIAVPTGATTVQLSIEPVTPPTTLPTDGVIDGNIYKFTAAVKGTVISTELAHPATIVLRSSATTGQPRAIEQLVSGTWHRVDASTLGCDDVHLATSTTLGDFALIDTTTRPPSSGVSGSSNTGNAPPWMLILIGALGVIALISRPFLVERTRRG